MTQNLIPLANHANTPLTMSSREIADLVEARHNDVIATIDRLFGKGLLRSSRKTRRESTGGRPVDVYDLIERDTHLVIAGYSDEHRARVVDRWQELEVKATQPPVALPDFTNPAIAARAWAEQFEAKAQAQEQLAIAAPKAQALDRITQADGEMCITNAAKTIGVQPKKLFEWMERHDWIYRRPGSKRHTAYQARIKAGYLTHKVTTVERSDGSEKVVESVIVTPRGLAKLAEVAA